MKRYYYDLNGPEWNSCGQDICLKITPLNYRRMSVFVSANIKALPIR